MLQVVHTDALEHLAQFTKAVLRQEFDEVWRQRPVPHEVHNIGEVEHLSQFEAQAFKQPPFSNRNPALHSVQVVSEVSHLKQLLMKVLVQVPSDIKQ